jgi:hypothetical protein
MTYGYEISPEKVDALYVATDLGFWKTDCPSQFSWDVQINDTMYRRLDPVYFAWLRRGLEEAKKAMDAGRVDADDFE